MGRSRRNPTQPSPRHLRLRFRKAKSHSAKIHSFDYPETRCYRPGSVRNRQDRRIHGRRTSEHRCDESQDPSAYSRPHPRARPTDRRRVQEIHRQHPHHDRLRLRRHQQVAAEASVPQRGSHSDCVPRAADRSPIGAGDEPVPRLLLGSRRGGPHAGHGLRPTDPDDLPAGTPGPPDADV